MAYSLQEMIYPFMFKEEGGQIIVLRVARIDLFI